MFGIMVKSENKNNVNQFMTNIFSYIIFSIHKYLQQQQQQNKFITYFPSFILILKITLTLTALMLMFKGKDNTGKWWSIGMKTGGKKW